MTFSHFFNKIRIELFIISGTIFYNLRKEDSQMRINDFKATDNKDQKELEKKLNTFKLEKVLSLWYLSAHRVKLRLLEVNLNNYSQEVTLNSTLIEFSVTSTFSLIFYFLAKSYGTEKFFSLNKK